MRTLKAVGNQVVIEPMAAETSINGIHIPGSIQLPASQGVVLSVGAKVVDVKPGMTVMFQRMYGPMKFDNKEVQILHQRDLIAVV